MEPIINPRVRTATMTTNKHTDISERIFDTRDTLGSDNAIDRSYLIHTARAATIRGENYVLEKFGRFGGVYISVYAGQTLNQVMHIHPHLLLLLRDATYVRARHVYPDELVHELKRDAHGITLAEYRYGDDPDWLLHLTAAEFNIILDRLAPLETYDPPGIDGETKPTPESEYTSLEVY